MAARLKQAAWAVLALLLLSGCGGNPLPAGMDEAALLEAGRDVMLLLVGGAFDEVHALLREDVAEGVTAEDLQSLTLRQPANPPTGRNTVWRCSTAPSPRTRRSSAWPLTRTWH